MLAHGAPCEGSVAKNAPKTITSGHGMESALECGTGGADGVTVFVEA